MNEASVVVDANDVWEVLDLLSDEKANKNLTDLINSHVRTEDEIMDAINSYVDVNWHGKVRKADLEKMFTDWMYVIVDDLGLDVDKYREDGQFVDPKKPVALEGSTKMSPEQKVIVDNAKKAAKRDGYDQYIIQDKNDGSWSFARKHIQDKAEFDSFYQEVVGIVTSDDLQYRPYSLAESEEDKLDEVKDGEKKYKKDGETKTLVTGSDKENKTNDKQEVTEMTIEQEIDNPWKLLEMLWGQGRENLRELLESELFDDEFVLQMIEDMEIRDLTALNDAFAYDFETILDMFGCDPRAWSKNLKIKLKKR